MNEAIDGYDSTLSTLHSTFRSNLDLLIGAQIDDCEDSGDIQNFIDFSSVCLSQASWFRAHGLRILGRSQAGKHKHLASFRSFREAAELFEQSDYSLSVVSRSSAAFEANIAGERDASIEEFSIAIVDCMFTSESNVFEGDAFDQVLAMLEKACLHVCEESQSVPLGLDGVLDILKAARVGLLDNCYAGGDFKPVRLFVDTLDEVAASVTHTKFGKCEDNMVSVAMPLSDGSLSDWLRSLCPRDPYLALFDFQNIEGESQTFTLPSLPKHA
jgi:hypothetical protein